jgi:hypothetical protein
MSLIINLISLTLGSFSAITIYKQQEVDYKMLGVFYCCASPYQFLKIYNSMDIVQRIRFNCTKPTVAVLTGLSCISIVNASMFGTGYVLGNSYAKMRDSSRLE